MTSKTISLKEETYRRLRGDKEQDESFSDVIDRLLDAEDQPLYGLVGLLDEEQATAHRDRSKAFRQATDDRLGTPDNP